MAVRDTFPERVAPAAEPAVQAAALPAAAPLPASPAQVIALQRTAGNAAVTRILQREPAVADARPASPISDGNLEQMRADVDFITARLKQQVLEAAEEQEMLDRVRAWADWDTSHAASGGEGTPFLDKFLVLLKTRTFSRSTARMLWGLAGEEWMNAYDGLFYELEDARQEQLQALVRKSQRQGTSGPETQQMQSVYGYVGKRVGMGSWGILKQMGLAVMSIADALIWAEWRREGRPGDPPQLSPSVAKSFDEAAGVLADIANAGATPEEMEREKKELMEEYGFGDRWGKIVGILMSAGMGSSGQAVKAISSAAQIAQGAQGVEAAAKKISLRIDAMRKENPKATWQDFLADDEVRLEIGNGLAALIGLIGSLAGDEGVVAEFLKRNHLLVSATVLTPMLKKAWMDFNDPVLALDPVKRQHTLEEDVATIVGTIASIIGSRYDAQKAQEKAAAEAKAKAEAQAKADAAKAELEPAAPVDAEDLPEPALSPTDEEGPAPRAEEDGPGVTSPDDMPNVLLVDVSPGQLEAVLVELEGSTATGREIARRVRAGELQFTLDAGRVTEGAVGLALPSEVHVSWAGSVQDVAGTLIHEAVHQGDPGLAGGAPRTEVEATARVAEFEYREQAGLSPRDSVEGIYRAVLEQGTQQGMAPADAQARAREAMIDMMRTDPKRYGVEPAGGGGQEGGGGPAASAPPEFQVVQAQYGNFPDLLPGQVIEFPGGERVWRRPIDNAIVVESTLQPGVGRAGYEHDLPARGDYDVQQIQDHYMERAHSQGQGTGFESPYGIRLAAEIINQGFQNVGVEEHARQLVGQGPPGTEFNLVTATKTQEGTLRMEWMEYKVEVESGGSKRDLFSFKLVAEGPSGMPEIQEVWQTADPALEQFIEMPEMDGMNARLQAMIAQERQDRGL